MKKAVLGLGNSSTLFYINEINTQYNLLHGGYSTCPFLLYQINFNDINPHLPQDFDVLLPKITEYLEGIKNLGITELLIPNITLHETLDKIKTDLRIIHAVDLTLKKLKESTIKKAVIFGTIFTMNSVYFLEKFKNENISLIIPEKDDQFFIDNFRKKVYNAEETAEEIEQFQDLFYLYSKQAPLVLACTELSVHSNISESIFDMVKIQIEEFLKI